VVPDPAAVPGSPLRDSAAFADALVRLTGGALASACRRLIRISPGLTANAQVDAHVAVDNFVDKSVQNSPASDGPAV